MMVDRPNPIDAPAQPSANCPECGYYADYKRSVELQGVCPECSELLESNEDD
jgi:predicted Zn-ribbon and HTH transcriptional regulator